MNYTYTCLNPIAAIGLNNLTDAYTRTEDFAAADAVFVHQVQRRTVLLGQRHRVLSSEIQMAVFADG